ncbi:zinc finger protein 22-like [Anopheles nili]|uniref:zinc finger protein 22-like n=1 Tax=Anopheles nili TaxID=185578 RepID=UPI00237AA9DA|nr:zinc finger protein 22-like [Anopheles nili]
MNESNKRKAEIKQLPTNVRDYCRVCLTDDSDGEKELYHIDDMYMKADRISEQMYSFRDMLAVFVNDELETHGGCLPTSICVVCADRAQQAFEFIEQCQTTDKQLEEHFQKVSMSDVAGNHIKEEHSEKYANEDFVVCDEIAIVAKPTDAELNSEPEEQVVNSVRETAAKNNKRNLETKVKSFKCDVCAKSFSQSQTLRRHYRMHDESGNMKKSCLLCSRQFLRSDDLKRHIRTHTGERPYKCKLCTKSYKQSSELKEHTLTHSDEKHFKCPECGKEFFSRNGLYVHLKVHKGIKPHDCPYCSKSFTTTSERSSHVHYIHRVGQRKTSTR